jgi:hypothetical protein
MMLEYGLQSSLDGFDSRPRRQNIMPKSNRRLPAILRFWLPNI